MSDVHINYIRTADDYWFRMRDERKSPKVPDERPGKSVKEEKIRAAEEEVASLREELRQAIDKLDRLTDSDSFRSSGDE